MARITIEEAKALGLKIEDIKKAEFETKNNLEKIRNNISKKNKRTIRGKNNNIEERMSESFAYWLKSKNIRFTHIANESNIHGKYAMIASIKKKRMGMSPGFPDYIIFLDKITVFIELKKTRTKKKNGEYKALSSDGIKISNEQQEWINFLDKREKTRAKICFGDIEAIDFIKSLQKI